MPELTIEKIRAKKNQKKLTMLTAYSASTAGILAQTTIDMLLVGDSLGMVFQGKENTLQVTVEEMIYHAKSVRTGAPNKFVVVDMPFMSFQVSAEQTLINAGKILKESNCQAVKLEGASETVLESIKRIVPAGIPVMGHLGFTPQGLNCLSGYKVQGKDEISAENILKEALAVEAAGAFAIVLEMVPAQVAKKITERLAIPTISCGAGKYCDGQVLVIDDVLGLYPKSPKFSKQYTHLNKIISDAINTYISEVEAGTFPDDKHSF